MAYPKTITDHITDSSFLAGSNKGGRILTAGDGETFTPGNALTVDADGNVEDSGSTPGGGVGGEAWPIGLLHATRSWDVPTLADWTQTNTTSPATTTAQRNRAIEMIHPNDTGANGEWQLYHMSEPSTPYSLTAWIAHLGRPGAGTTHTYAGIGFRESSSGKFALSEILGDNSLFKFRSELWTDVFTPSTNYVTGTPTFWSNVDSPSVDSAPKFYIAITNDGTDRKVHYSYTGHPDDWIELDSRAFNADLTPDQIVFGNNSDNAGEVRTFFLGLQIRTGSTLLGPA